MSIIAETLQRLQTHTKGGEPESSEPSSLILPPRGKREPGWHTRPSRGKFWLAGLGMVVVLSSLALGAYWIGMSWDFGLASYASPGTGYPLSLSESVPIPETAPSGFPTDEIPAMPEEPPSQEVSFSSSPRSEEGTSLSREPVLSQGPASPENFGPPKQENQLFETNKIPTPVSANKTSPTPIPVSQGSHSHVMPKSNNDTHGKIFPSTGACGKDTSHTRSHPFDRPITAIASINPHNRKAEKSRNLSP